jgi:erythromycin esterase-like protein/predicted phosphoribosyltransferase
VLACQLDRYRDDPRVIVVALPPGGVPVAYEIAAALGAPLDVFLVRKFHVPGREGLAMGAIASGGVVVLNEDVIRGLDIRPEVIQTVAVQEGRELLRQEEMYREGRPMPDLTGKTIVVVDDGLATGASMHAAIQALHRLRPARIVVAVPTAPEATYQELCTLVDEVVCAATPSPAFAIGSSYWNFAPPTSGEIRDLLGSPMPPRPAGTGGRGPSAATVIRAAAVPVTDGVPSDDALFDLVGDAPLVLLGAASSGTHEFYTARARMTRRLIEDRGFCAVAGVGDWPASYQVDRYVRGHGADAEAALRAVDSFPTWPWRNTAVLEFVEWLREYNDRVADDRAMAGLYGLDMFSRYQSVREVVSDLDRIDPAAAVRARERLACIDHYKGEEGQADCYAAAFGAGELREREEIERLVDLNRYALDRLCLDARCAEDEAFYAEQKARISRDAEEYHRSMFTGRPSSWTLRERHMFATLRALMDHLGRRNGRPPKIVVWAHNSHLGDGRATEAAVSGEVNVGQLVRAAYPGACRLIGFTTYTGTVTAAGGWGEPPERMRVRPALPESVEALLHDVGEEGFLIPFTGASPAAGALRPTRLERAIGIVYKPQTERQSHYLQARIADQFDAVIHIDETRALEPLDRPVRWAAGQAPETSSP